MLAWRRVGEGPPLLLINGYAATKDDWDPGFVDGLASASTVICPDNPGVGESARADGELTIRSIAEELAGLMDELSIETAAVVGWSMGGFVAQELAALAPDRVEALLLLSTDPGGPAAPTCDDDVLHRLTDRSGTPEEQARRLLGLLFPPDLAERLFAEFGEVVAAARAQLSDEALSAQEAAMTRWHAEPADERVAALRAPTLVAAGSEDVVVPPENAELLSSARVGSWLARFPGGGHAFMAQEPRRLGALINAFLGRG